MSGRQWLTQSVATGKLRRRPSLRSIKCAGATWQRRKVASSLRSSRSRPICGLRSRSCLASLVPAMGYVRATPPTSPLLFEYGHDFPNFIEQYEYGQSVPWLADVARIERSRLQPYPAADIQPAMPPAWA